MRKIFSYFSVILFLLTVIFAKAQVPGSAIDVQHYTFAIQLNDENNNIKGDATIDIKFLKDVNTFRLNLVKKNSKGYGMLVSSIKEKGKEIHFTQDSDVVNIDGIAKANAIHTYTISYSGIPAARDGLIISTNKF